jgi:hypothetical protein
LPPSDSEASSEDENASDQHKHVESVGDSEFERAISPKLEDPQTSSIESPENVFTQRNKPQQVTAEFGKAPLGEKDLNIIVAETQKPTPNKSNKDIQSSVEKGKENNQLRISSASYGTDKKL